ncbi:MAG: hypothetical protein U0840_10095 [Gemmataceae bacterium]
MHPLLMVVLSVSVAWSAAPPERISEERQRAIEEARQMFARAEQAHWQARSLEEAIKLFLAVRMAREKLYTR